MTERHPYYPAGNPRFNHVAMSVPADLLDEANRADLCRFWSEVFGFDELPTMTQDRRRLIFSCVHWQQFVFLIAEDDPMRCPRLDHFGLSVGSPEDLHSAWERAVTYRDKDPRVDVIDPSIDDQGVVKIHSMYVGYLLPMMCELQYWEFTPPPG
ncbi:MAG: hypothetical protein WKF43_09215 [Acidimicrobiales bacterium]